MNLKEKAKQEIESLDWKGLRNYCKDSGINTKGLTKEEIVPLAIEQRIVDIQNTETDKYEIKNISSKELTPDENFKENMTRLVTVTVQNLNPNESKLPSKIITIGNMQRGFTIPSYVVQFNKKQRLPIGIVNYLRTKEFRTSKKELNKYNVPITVNITKRHYHIIVEPEISKAS